jgi:hypothetical protein
MADATSDAKPVPPAPSRPAALATTPVLATRTSPTRHLLPISWSDPRLFDFLCFESEERDENAAFVCEVVTGCRHEHGNCGLWKFG